MAEGGIQPLVSAAGGAVCGLELWSVKRLNLSLWATCAGKLTLRRWSQQAVSATSGKTGQVVRRVNRCASTRERHNPAGWK